METEMVAFRDVFASPLKNGLTRPKAVRGNGEKMINMGELFAHGRIADIAMDRVPVSDREREAFSVESGDLLFARQSLVLSGAGKCSIYLGLEYATFESHIIRARLNRRIADSRYYFYFFSSPLGRTTIETIVEQVAAAGIRGSDLAALLVPKPSLSEQRAIASTLSVLDDRIELNRKMSATLEAIARALFKSWFVDFDPVRAKVEGRDTGLPAEIAALFPDSFENSELGDIPKGWCVASLGELVSFEYGKPLKADGRQGGAVPVYGSNGVVGWHNEALVSGPGIVVGRKGNPGTVTWAQADFCPIDTTFYVVPKRELSLRFLFFALAAHDLPHLSADSAVPGLNRHQAYMSKQLLPPRDILKKFDSLVVPLNARTYQTGEESKTLASLRDALLPKLISGELRVSDVERLVEKSA
jgi:type I restriction enzyme S subunit